MTLCVRKSICDLSLNFIYVNIIFNIISTVKSKYVIPFTRISLLTEETKYNEKMCKFHHSNHFRKIIKNQRKLERQIEMKNKLLNMLYAEIQQKILKWLNIEKE